MWERPNRYTRDSVAGQLMRRYLRDNNIELYVQTTRDDLWSPSHNFTATIHQGVSQQDAENIYKYSTDGKFEALKKGKPLSDYPFLWDLNKDKDIFSKVFRSLFFKPLYLYLYWNFILL